MNDTHSDISQSTKFDNNHIKPTSKRASTTTLTQFIFLDTAEKQYSIIQHITTTITTDKKK